MWHIVYAVLVHIKMFSAATRCSDDLAPSATSGVLREFREFRVASVFRLREAAGGPREKPRCPQGDHTDETKTQLRFNMMHFD